MSPPLPLEITENAASQIEAAADWWGLNRSKAPDAVYEELVRAFELVTRQPAAGTHDPRPKLPGLRRVRLARIRMYLYYHVDGDPPQLVVLALWHESRDSDPPL